MPQSVRWRPDFPDCRYVSNEIKIVEITAAVPWALPSYFLSTGWENKTICAKQKWEEAEVWVTVSSRQMSCSFLALIFSVQGKRKAPCFQDGNSTTWLPECWCLTEPRVVKTTWTKSLFYLLIWKWAAREGKFVSTPESCALKENVTFLGQNNVFLVSFVLSKQGQGHVKFFSGAFSVFCP